VRAALSSILLALLVPVPAGAAAPDLLFFYAGDPDPTGADQAFLALGRRRGAAVARETPGQLAEAPLGTLLARGVTDYQRLQFKEAIATFDATEREALVRGGGTLTQGELVDLYAYRAAARSALGDDAAAWDDLLALVTLAPTRPLDPARFPPRLIDSARRAAEARKQTARLTLTAQPPDALLIVDGEVVGRGQVEITRPIGRHLIRAERSGFAPAARPFELAGDQSLALHLTPLPPPATADLAHRGQLAGTRRVVAAFVTTGPDDKPLLTLHLIDAGGQVAARAQLPDDDRLTTTALAGAVDGLLGEAPVLGHAPERRWWRSPLVWGVIGGAVAVGLGVGLGVGLAERDSSTHATADLGQAR
jgi:hypothetical protein